MNNISHDEYLASAGDIARQAGKLIMGYFTSQFTTKHKEDKSPVTNADIEANSLIVNALRKMTPHIPIVAEEDEEILQGEHARFWLVDPLDGTRSFVSGEGEFSVNIGLIKDRRPVLGIIYSPTADALYWGEVGKGAYRSIKGGAVEAIHTKAPGSSGMVVTRSRSHPSSRTSHYLQSLSISAMIPMSSATKFCLVAEGSADIYPRFGRTMEWDTAAGHAIVEAAGGRVETADGKPLLYGKPNFENPHFIAYGK